MYTQHSLYIGTPVHPYINLGSQTCGGSTGHAVMQMKVRNLLMFKSNIRMKIKCDDCDFDHGMNVCTKWVGSVF